MMNTKDKLCQEIISCQRTLYSYILKLLPDVNDAKDVLQETNIILLNKEKEITDIDNFGAWAAKIAYYQVLAFRSRKRRGKLYYDDELLKLIAEEQLEEVTSSDKRLNYLGQCLVKLKEQDLRLLKLRYTGDQSVTTIAKELGRTARAISQALYRIRSALLKCIEHSQQLDQSVNHD